MVLSLLRGWVVPRSVLVDRMADKDGQIEALATERDDWKSAYHKVKDINIELVKQNTGLIHGGEATTRLLDSMREHLDRNNPQREIGTRDESY